MSEGAEVGHLLRAARDGDDEAYQALLALHMPALRGFVVRRLPPHLRRKISITDVLQETAWAGWCAIERFEHRGEGSFRAWILKIAERKAQDVLRHYASQRRAAFREVRRGLRASTQDVPAGNATPSEEAAANELAERIREGLGELSAVQRLVLHMVRVEGASMAEIGRRMGRSAGAVQKVYERAKARLWSICFGDEPATRGGDG